MTACKRLLEIRLGDGWLSPTGRGPASDPEEILLLPPTSFLLASCNIGLIAHSLVVLDGAGV